MQGWPAIHATFKSDVFNAVDQAMGIIDKYAEKIERAAEEIVALFETSKIELRKKQQAMDDYIGGKSGPG